MDRADVSARILAAKQQKGTTWSALSEATGLADVFIVSCVYGENSMSPDAAERFCKWLELGNDVAAALCSFPVKGQSLGQLVPTDPLVYRFYEIMQVYGLALKDVIQEKCGHGIMSAIDFTLDVAKQSDPKGDRVVITMNGKFLPYKSW